MTRINRILVPIDFSETSDAALAYARGLATPLGASLHLVHVFDGFFAANAFAPGIQSPISDEARAAARRTIEAQLDARLPEPDRRRFRGTTEIRTGLIATAIVDCANDHDVDLIVMGTHGRGGVVHMLLGSVAERVLRVAPCPVLTVRAANVPRDIVWPREQRRAVAAL